MKLLFDSHVILWTVYEPERLSPLVTELVTDEANELYVSLATVWELGNKAVVHRLPLAGSSVERMIERIEQLGVIFLPITRSEILASINLPHHHADPFDRVLIAQAQAHQLHLLTKDAHIARYDVPILWQ
ncbi:type II toxin-antitoxin system VapC family toxin [Edaphobacter aggregans]|uniref:type II toxin-antitoxin system VapC family toxin n=1 Tax=Edaphobacter aggregans TaxID=570835 RepID=UPI00054D55CD|nr:type II toxin-antitoxin system VapC family toxin [Edaphobacter aggregans]